MSGAARRPGRRSDARHTAVGIKGGDVGQPGYLTPGPLVRLAIARAKPGRPNRITAIVGVNAVVLAAALGGRCSAAASAAPRQPRERTPTRRLIRRSPWQGPAGQ